MMVENAAAQNWLHIIWYNQLFKDITDCQMEFVIQYAILVQHSLQIILINIQG